MLTGLAWRVPLSLLIVASTVWGVLALWFRGPQTPLFAGLAIGASLVPGALAMTALFVPSLRGPYGLSFVIAGAGFAALLGWWQTVTPTHDRDWAPDVARMLDSRRSPDGDRVTLINVRNFEWRSRQDFTPRWETREYDLSRIESVDVIVSSWGLPGIAHTLVSFGFADGRYLTFSVEVRRTRGTEFSALGGLFRQTELVLVAADERDIIRTRSNVRGETVRLYRVALPARERRALFEAYLAEADALRARPRFYNTVFSNCTTIVYDMVKRIVPGVAWDPRLLLSADLPQYLYELGALDNSRAFEELKRRGRINARARASDEPGAADDFSQAIRRGVPAPDGSLILPETPTRSEAAQLSR